MATEPDKDEALESAARSIIDKMAATADEFLKSKDSHRVTHDEQRELAASARNLRPLFDAFALSIGARPGGSKSEYAKYKYGYLLRLLEATLDVAIIAGAQKLRDVMRSNGGVESARVRNAKKDREWRDDAKQFAIDLVKKKSPEIPSQGELAEEIRFHFGDRVPGHRQVQSFIATLQKCGELPRKPLK